MSGGYSQHCASKRSVGDSMGGETLNEHRHPSAIWPEGAWSNRLPYVLPYLGEEDQRLSR